MSNIDPKDLPQEMRLKDSFPDEQRLRTDESLLIAQSIDQALGTSIYPDGNYSVYCRSPEIQKHPLLATVLQDLLGVVTHPAHVQWLVRCLPLNQRFDGSFLEQYLHKVEYRTVLQGWGDTISRSKMTGVEGLIRKVLEDPEIEHRDKMFFVLAAPGRLPKDEARRHVLDFIPIGPGVAAEAIRKIAEPDDLATFEELLTQKLDSWDRRRIETTVRQLRKKFG